MLIFLMGSDVASRIRVTSGHYIYTSINVIKNISGHFQPLSIRERERENYGDGCSSLDKVVLQRQKRGMHSPLHLAMVSSY